MLFTRTHKYTFAVSKEELTGRLLGKHVKIHDLDFEVLEKGSALSIIPHAEQVVAIKTLPITSVDLIADGKNTKAVITFKMRGFDSGGPMLVIIFCSFMLIAAAVLFNVAGEEKTLSYTLVGISAAIIVIFSIRMQTGYFDYIRKIRAYVKSKGEQSEAEANVPVVAL